MDTANVTYCSTSLSCIYSKIPLQSPSIITNFASSSTLTSQVPTQLLIVPQIVTYPSSSIMIQSTTQNSTSTYSPQISTQSLTAAKTHHSSIFELGVNAPISTHSSQIHTKPPNFAETAMCSSSIVMPTTQTSAPLNELLSSQPVVTPSLSYSQTVEDLQDRDISSKDGMHNNSDHEIERFSEESSSNEDFNDSHISLKTVSKQIRALTEGFNKLNEKLNEKFNAIETLLKQNLKRKVPAKPNILPMRSLEEVVAFDNCEQEIYDNVVCWFEYIGGFTLKDSASLCLKQTMLDDVAMNFTWTHNNPNVPDRMALNKRLITTAIRDAVSNNTYFNVPTKNNFEKVMQDALRVMKQRRNVLKRRN